jgi:hypothetical protein
MYKTISNNVIRKLNLDYDPSRYIKDENEELSIRNWIKKYRKVIPIKDIIWLLVREDFLSEKDLRLFSVWCAREALKLIENPDHRSIEACNIVEKYANGEATEEELNIARDITGDVINDAYYANASYASKATYSAAHAATVAAYVPYTSHYISYSARLAAHYASDAAATSDTVSNAANAANVARNAQLEQLLTYFE